MAMRDMSKTTLDHYLLMNPVFARQDILAMRTKLAGIYAKSQHHASLDVYQKLWQWTSRSGCAKRKLDVTTLT